MGYCDTLKVCHCHAENIAPVISLSNEIELNDYEFHSTFIFLFNCSLETSISFEPEWLIQM